MEEEYLATIAKYTEGQKGKRPVDQLAAAFGKLIAIMEETRADILGDLFQGGITYGERGQFFTPTPICDLMAELTAGDEPGLGRTINDPCCGSGRMLLAMAKIKPFARFVGQDADLRCVKITAINLALHNLYGHVIWGNSLANERKLIYETGFDGKGVIRVIPIDKAAAPSQTPTADAGPGLADDGPSTGIQNPTTQGTLFDEMEE